MRWQLLQIFVPRPCMARRVSLLKQLSAWLPRHAVTHTAPHAPENICVVWTRRMAVCLKLLGLKCRHSSPVQSQAPLGSLSAES